MSVRLGWLSSTGNAEIC